MLHAFLCSDTHDFITMVTATCTPILCTLSTLPPPPVNLPSHTTARVQGHLDVMSRALSDCSQLQHALVRHVLQSHSNQYVSGICMKHWHAVHQFSWCARLSHASCGVGGELKMLPSPALIIPGCMPRNGTSKFTMPMMRWRNTSAMSAASKPPME